MYGTRVAVLAGDFLFAQSSWFLANLDNLEVIKLISQVIADFANGEISQAASLFDTDITLEKYLDKSFYKTASLVAASCRSAAVFSDAPVSMKEAMYSYGKHLGLAFQVVDDILDFTQSTEQLGKPQVGPCFAHCCLHLADMLYAFNARTLRCQPHARGLACGCQHSLSSAALRRRKASRLHLGKCLCWFAYPNVCL